MKNMENFHLDVEIHLNLWVSQNLVHFNKHLLPFNMFLLLFCGDIELYSGDGVTCLYCSKLVLDSEKAKCCDLCNCWVHLSCDPTISTAKYDALVLMSITHLYIYTAAGQSW